jgi:Zn-dependent protease
MDGFDRASDIWIWIARLPPLIFAITVHEVAHGWVAKKFGDPTAQNAGRLTLNPIKHVDPIGTIVVPIVLWLFTPFILGWAKPVPVDFRRLDNPRRDMILVAAAGPASNILMALIWTVVMVAALLFLPIWGEGQANLMIDDMAKFGILVNLFLAVFNMLPIPPLDGGRVLAGLLPPPMARALGTIEPFGILIILGIFALDFYTNVEFLLPFILVPVAELQDVFYSLAEYLLMMAGAA